MGHGLPGEPGTVEALKAERNRLIRAQGRLDNKLADTEARLDEVEAERDTLRTQNAKLLEALKWAHDRIHPPHDDGRPSCALTCPARAAMKEVEG